MLEPVLYCAGSGNFYRLNRKWSKTVTNLKYKLKLKGDKERKDKTIEVMYCNKGILSIYQLDINRFLLLISDL